MTPLTIPAWGTAPKAPAVTRYTVIGFYAYNGQRFCEHVTAENPRAAEDLVKADLGQARAADGSPADPQVCGVLAIVDGQITAVDAYAVYLDPDTPEQT